MSDWTIAMWRMGKERWRAELRGTGLEALSDEEVEKIAVAIKAFRDTDVTEALINVEPEETKNG